MNNINIRVNLSREVEMTSVSGGVTGENNASVINFEVPDELSSYNKYLDVFKENGEKTQTVLSLKKESEFSYVLPGELSKNLNVFMQLVFKKGNEIFKSYRFSLVFEEGINATTYLESEYRDSIQTLFETKAEKSETDTLKKSIADKVNNITFLNELAVRDEKISKKAEKTDIPSVPQKISELYDDTPDKPIENAIYSMNSEASITASASIYAEVADSADKDGKGNDIISTYATKFELAAVENTIGDINIALERIIAIQNGLMGVSE